MHFFYFLSAQLPVPTSVMSEAAKPASDEPADLLRTQRINFSYVKIHAIAARVLPRDPSVV